MNGKKACLCFNVCKISAKTHHFPLFLEILITMYRSLHSRVVSHLNVTQGYWAIKYAKNHFKVKEVNNPLKEKLSSFVDL